MRSARFEHLLAGTAIALALGLTPYVGKAFSQSERAIAAAVPMPESADLPPPSIKDIAPADAAAMKPEASAETAATKPAAAEVTSTVPAASRPTRSTRPFLDRRRTS